MNNSLKGYLKSTINFNLFIKSFIPSLSIPYSL
ncbi:hypothetical protein [Pantoea phage vB_PdeP_F1M1C]|nr:hypothetical protein [Pantoea phage vB_PdeP_F1M1C]